MLHLNQIGGIDILFGVVIVLSLVAVHLSFSKYRKELKAERDSN